jgi:preprotein translocase subunit SecD
MSDLRFIDELGAEFKRVAELRGTGRQGRGGQARRRLAPALGYGLAALAVIAVIVVALAIKGHGSPSPSAQRAQVTVTFRVAGVPSATVLRDSITILQDRLDAAFKDVQVRQSEGRITVAVRSAGSNTRARVIALAQPGELAFYDWEANALTPSGETVASQLASQDPTALSISQGGTSAPGGVGAGCISLDQARSLSATRHGTIVVSAIAQTLNEQGQTANHQAGFFVLYDRPALTGSQITNPVTTVDQSGQPAVSFGFTKSGALAFQQLTAGVAHRGALVSSLGQTLDQHFAVAVDHRLITVPSIDFKAYPDGVPGNNGADITGAFTPQSARDLSTLLRYGPVAVRLIAITRA